MTASTKQQTKKQNRKNKTTIATPTFDLPKPAFISSTKNTKQGAKTTPGHLASKTKNRRANSVSPVSGKSTNPTPVLIGTEISRPCSVEPSLYSEVCPRRLFVSDFNHSHYADGSYANAPHPSELPPPQF
uniref:Uncharacterized protein n=1 Tax=Vannella robusta TaxID=1487602 RepID=A0A7S4HR88_9EUKA|mmetsp:Transcript_14427/g.18309  ORF Transcript_14427/g.18309 Transcript_14427/m.18309 type:complete len:130 (+) Transcript_14427:124-513(+)